MVTSTAPNRATDCMVFEIDPLDGDVVVNVFPVPRVNGSSVVPTTISTNVEKNLLYLTGQTTTGYVVCIVYATTQCIRYRQPSDISLPFMKKKPGDSV